MKAAAVVCVWLGLVQQLCAQGKAGVCAHVTRDQEFASRIRIYEMLQEAGFAAVRSDFDWCTCQSSPSASFEFSTFDHVVDDAARHGIEILPILCSPPSWARPVHEHIEEWRAYVRAVMLHFKGRVSAVEVWNEENISSSWPNPNPGHYAKVLKAAYEEVKTVDPSVRVAFGGTAGCDVGFIEKTILAGARRSFDAVCIHPYCQPHSADPILGKELAGLREMMKRHGLAKCPVWITEMGWPTHRARIPDTLEFRAGLKIADPERTVWHAAYVPLGEPCSSDMEFAECLKEILPEGSTCAAVSPKGLEKALMRKMYDLVVYPFTESYPDETIDAVREFVKKGGTVVVFGGYPFYFPYRGGKYAGTTAHGAKEGEEARARFRIGVQTWWRDAMIPETARAFPSEEARRVGLAVDPAGLPVGRFFSMHRQSKDDRLIPILVAKDKDGNDIVGAGVYKYGDMKGSVIVSSRGKMSDSITEEVQAERVVEAMKIAFAQGVERYFIYEFQAPEGNPYYSEHHFGIVHRDCTPKPAYEACRRYLKNRGKSARE